jgi:hypothetical protein
MLNDRDPLTTDQDFSTASRFAWQNAELLGTSIEPSKPRKFEFVNSANNLAGGNPTVEHCNRSVEASVLAMSR